MPDSLPPNTPRRKFIFSSNSRQANTHNFNQLM